VRTDAQIREDIFTALGLEPSVRELEIALAVKDGVATLSGHVASFAQKFTAANAAERVNGVRAVADELKVKLWSDQECSDTDVAHAVANVLECDTEVPHETVKARIDTGWIWLEGEVEYQFQKHAAERAIRALAGVKGVTNAIRVQQMVDSQLQHTDAA
jgi:osmotically-inducible protein OsmY